MVLFKQHSRVRVALSVEAIKKLEDTTKAFNAMQPILPSQKTQTREEWLEKQKKTLTYSPCLAGFSNTVVSSQKNAIPQKIATHKINCTKKVSQNQR